MHLFGKVVVTGGLISALMLAGCSKPTMPDDIRTWKAEGDTAKLITAVQDPVQQIRIASIRALGELQSEDAIEALTKLFTDTETVVAYAAVDAVAAIGGPRSEASMLKALDLEGTRPRLTAVTALAELKSTKAVEPLIEALNDRDEHIAVAAAEALAIIADPAGIQPLAEKMNSPSRTMRMACAEALCRLGGEEAISATAPMFDDISPDVRKMAVDAFIGLGEPAIPYALEALRSPRQAVQRCGLSILEGLNAVPRSGGQAVWHQLVRISLDDSETIDHEIAIGLTGIEGDILPALLEAAASPSDTIRDMAALALEYVGEIAVGPAMQAVQEQASSEALQWYDQRGTWPGAPAWHLDLWGAVAALSPDFSCNPNTRAAFEAGDMKALRLMKNPRFRPDRAYIPMLVDQLSTDHNREPLTLFGFVMEQVSEASPPDRRQLKAATIQLTRAGSPAVFPLIAGLSDQDIQVVGACAFVLGDIGDGRAVQPLMDHLKAKLDAGEPMTDSDVYEALQKFDGVEVDALLAKVRPSAKYAEALLCETYPGIEVIRTTPYNLKGAVSEPVMYAIAYLYNGRQGDINITFRRTNKGDWIPHPALPEALP